MAGAICVLKLRSSPIRKALLWGKQFRGADCHLGREEQSRGSMFDGSPPHRLGNKLRIPKETSILRCHMGWSNFTATYVKA